MGVFKLMGKFCSVAVSDYLWRYFKAGKGIRLHVIACSKKKKFPLVDIETHIKCGNICVYKTNSEEIRLMVCSKFNKTLFIA